MTSPFTRREPAVAGRFYPSAPAALEREVLGYLGELEPGPARAVVVPHAGYVYSGAIAGQAYRRVRVPETAVVLCPNHTGRGPRLALFDGDAFCIPGATVSIDRPLSDALVASAQRADLPLERDRTAHEREHSAEVQVPFLVALRADVQLVPLCLARLSWAECAALGAALAGVIATRREQGSDVLLVASTDMSHYIDATTARRLDGLALDRIAALDPEGLLRVVEERGISMCGVIPTTVALVAAAHLGATQASVVAYGNSGQTSGAHERVVGYAAALVC